MQMYGNKMMELSKQLMTILLRCLGDGFDAKYYESEFGRCHGYMRINSYSARGNTEPKDSPPKNTESEEIEGLGMHTDMSCLTILYQDEVGGLQVREKDGKWMDIKYSEGELVVNIGDLLQAWSNGKFRSSQHRVVLRKPSSRRLSVAFFWCFEDEKMIVAPDVGEEERIYRPFVCGDYIKFKVISEKGRFDKVKYTIDDFVEIDATAELMNKDFM
ncbi:gibberellin 20-oxidase-like protein [Phalaenopsis equestris]|uniref:gibberellin 20-oxidase-like protein n=1 Tax=Phalaenopsis equestris TaxID=78828 RepID=UPI0009E5EFA6|nr:gibberellin 20-oxidase-like protein [Phalaenopsis equestris]